MAKQKFAKISSKLRNFVFRHESQELAAFCWIDSNGSEHWELCVGNDCEGMYIQEAGGRFSFKGSSFGEVVSKADQFFDKPYNHQHP